MSAIRRRRLTLRARLTLVYGGLFLLGGAVLLATTYVLLQDALRGRAGSTGTISISPPAVPERTVKPAAGVSPAPSATGQSASAADGPVDGTEISAYTLYERFTDAALTDLVTRGTAALLVVAVAALGAGWVVAGRAMRPIHQVTAAARRVASNNLRERIALDGPRDELYELGATFNSMLARVDEAFKQLNHAFDGQRRFAANASHELRTPLTLNRALLEVALDAPDVSADVRVLATQLLTVNERHERLIEGMLTLARAENNVMRPEPVDLAEAAYVAVKAVRAEAVDRGVDLASTLEPAPTAGDPVQLEQLAHNLVRNAVRYNVPGGAVTVRTGHRGDGAELLVSNTGPLLAEADVPKLFEPFHRHAERQDPNDGAGLGLAIVEAVVRAHYGTIRAEPRCGGGLTVRVVIPAEAEIA